MTPIIQATGLVKKYGDKVAVNGIDFTVQEQECFGFLGPNGAGKTSTLRMIGCVSPISAGKLVVDSKDVTREGRAIKAVLGVVPQRENLDPDLSVWQNLLVYARYFDIPRPPAERRAGEVLEFFQLQDRKQSLVPTLSEGMKRRLLIARALINQPRILLLDEPTSGLDPQARLLVWQRLRQLKSGGVTLLLTTHNMEEATHLCDRLVIMHLGNILVEGTPQELVARYIGGKVLELHPQPEEREMLLERLKERETTVTEIGDTLYLYNPNGNALKEEEIKGEAVLRSATLEDVFLKLTGRGLEE